tara:strand:- start:1427 stop:1618 length:192 start_codon:yes stop_codon:yes gene_type:complete
MDIMNIIETQRIISLISKEEDLLIFFKMILKVCNKRLNDNDELNFEFISDVESDDDDTMNQLT